MRRQHGPPAVPVSLAISLLAALAAAAQPVALHVIPNTHGTVCGWLVDFDTERNYVLNNYLAHLDRVRADEAYRFAFSEVPNLISLLELAPERLGELKQRIKEKRVELSNGFFLEPDVNLSGGEALVQMGVLGLGWYQQVFGFRPRHCWMIDVTGAHRQLPQLVAGLGMDSLFFNRNNPARSPVFWWVAPDGTRTLALTNGTYLEFRGKDSIFGSKEPLGEDGYKAIAGVIEAKRKAQPGRDVLFSLAGASDYSLPPARDTYPSEFLREWSRRYPGLSIRFSTPSDYVDALLAEVNSGRSTLEAYTGDTGYSWDAFWLNMPEVKQYYRKDEHLLAAAEALATATSLRTKFAYPSQGFYDSWINLLMNMDRNTIWGAAAGSVFKDLTHWDAWDRFASVEEQSRGTAAEALRVLAGEGSGIAFFNPLNWKRNDPIVVELPPGQELEGAVCEAIPGEPRVNVTRAVCGLDLPPAGIRSYPLRQRVPAKPSSPAERPTPPEVIETEYYTTAIDLATGALRSLKVKPTGEELLGGPANVLVTESAPPNQRAEFMPPRLKRRQLDADSAECRTPDRWNWWDAPLPPVRVQRRPFSTVVTSSAYFCNGSKVERTMVFYRNHPRIDCDIRLDLRAADVLVTVDFPLAGEPVERSRGIPYGFSSIDPRRTSGAILPSVRWSNYQLESGAGLALLDRGLTGHELNGRTLTLALVNAVSQYRGKPNEILRGQSGGRPASDVRFFREYSYALVPHAGSWQQAAIPRRAWEFNAPPIVAAGSGTAKQESLIETSDNVIVEAVRRTGRQIEVRLVESTGREGTAEITLRLPHRGASLTNMMGENPRPLPGGPAYRFPIRPQQIVTLRFGTASAVAAPAIVRTWKPLVPSIKRRALETRLTEKGHPGL